MNEYETMNKLRSELIIVNNMIKYNKEFEPKNDNKSLICKKNALKMAIKALEKQIPKKPKMRHTKDFDGYNDGWCPCCGKYVQELEYDKKYCQECGQKLDWGEENE